jgi:predicted DNA-binding transcriptional regulator YafY
MKSATRPQYHRLQRILEMVREGTRTGSLPNCGHFTRELEVSRRTLMRDLDFLRDGSLELRLRTSSRKELTRWVLSWVPHVRVLAPRQLGERVRQRMCQGLAGCG